VAEGISLKSATRSLPVASGELRRLESDLAAPLFALTVAGVDALRAWQHFRDQSFTTGYWPVIVGEYGGPAFGGSEAALEGLLEEVQLSQSLSDDQLHFRRTGRTPSEILELARDRPFEDWIKRQHDSTFQEQEHLRKALYFDGLGAASLAKLHREWAERWRQTAPWTFEPEGYVVPPKVNHSPPQHELHCVKCYDDEKRDAVIAASVTMLFAPTRNSWEVPAFLFYTTKELERPPSVHVAALKWLSDQFQAELVGIEGRILEVIPRLRPGTTLEALNAAAMLREYSDCTVTSENEMTSIDELATYLMQSDFWTFCWP
jgi:hypothetical protein